MSINAKAVKSIRKTDLVSQKTPFVAFKTFSFAHEATAGQTVISLSALTTPTSYAARGFLQPSVSDLSSADLLLYRRNLDLKSTFRGPLLEYDAYDITGSLTIRLSFPAEAGEIFIGKISDVAKTGLQVIDGQSLVSTGVLAANTADYPVGQAFSLNKNSSKQVGDVLVYLGGQLMYRNVGNATASVSADGNYEEVDGGSGLSNTIRFNIVDPLKARPVVVVSNGMLAERPEASIRATIETLAGQNDSIIETLAVVAGVPTTNFRSAPNSVDLQTFGQRVITMESNRARIDQSNTWTAVQSFLNKTDGVSVPSGQNLNGEIFTFTDSSLRSVGNTQNSFMDAPSLSWTLQPGKWLMFLNAMLQIDSVTGAGAGDGIFGVIAIRTSANALVASTTVGVANLNVQRFFGSAPVIGFAEINVATVYKVSVQLIPISAAVTVSGSLIRGDLSSFPTTLKAIRLP